MYKNQYNSSVINNSFPIFMFIELLGWMLIVHNVKNNAVCYNKYGHYSLMLSNRMPGCIIRSIAR